MKRSGYGRDYGDSGYQQRRGKRRFAPSPVVVSSDAKHMLASNTTSVNLGSLLSGVPAAYFAPTNAALSADPSLNDGVCAATIRLPRHKHSPTASQLLAHAKDLDGALKRVLRVNKHWDLRENSILLSEEDVAGLERHVIGTWRAFADAVRAPLENEALMSTMDDVKLCNVVDQHYRDIVCGADDRGALHAPCWAVVGPSGIGKRSLLNAMLDTPSARGAVTTWDMSTPRSLSLSNICESLSDVILSRSFADDHCGVADANSFGGGTGTRALSHFLWRPIVVRDLDHLMDLKHFSEEEKERLALFLADLFTSTLAKLVPLPLGDSEEEFAKRPPKRRTRPVVVVVIESRASFHTRSWLRTCFAGASTAGPRQNGGSDYGRRGGSDARTLRAAGAVYLTPKIALVPRISWLRSLRSQLSDEKWARRFAAAEMPRFAALSRASLDAFLTSSKERSMYMLGPMGPWLRQLDFALLGAPEAEHRDERAVSGDVLHVTALDYKADLDDIVVQQDRKGTRSHASPLAKAADRCGDCESAWRRATSSSSRAHVMDQVSLRLEAIVASAPVVAESSLSLARASPQFLAAKEAALVPLRASSHFCALKSHFVDMMNLFGHSDELSSYVELATSLTISQISLAMRCTATAKYNILNQRPAPISGYWTRAQLSASFAPVTRAGVSSARNLQTQWPNLEGASNNEWRSALEEFELRREQGMYTELETEAQS